MNDLPKRESDIENDIEAALVDEHGLVRSALNMDTMKPFSPGYFKGMNIHDYPGRNWENFSEYMEYENVGMCSGAYLAAMIWKYRATKNPDALEKAFRTFKGIKWLFDASQEIDEGYYCKCYGGKMSEQISSDQYIYTFAGLDEFMDFAAHHERSQCAGMIDKMVRFWMRRNYSYPYFGKPLDWPIERFPAFAWLAYQHTGKKEFYDEFMRLCSIPETMEKIPFVGCSSFEDVLKKAGEREPWFEFEKNSGRRLISLNPEGTESGFLSLEALLEYNAPHRKIWLEKTWKMFDLNRRWMTDDGYSMYWCLYNMKTGEITEVREVLNCPQQSDRWKFFGFVGWIRSGMRSAMFARAGVAIQAYFPGAPILETTAHILKNLTRDKLRWLADMDGKQFPPDLKWMGNVYSGDAATHWLWAYWEACARYGTRWHERF